MVTSKIPAAMQWARDHFQGALDTDEYRDDDGGKKYFLIKEEDERRNGKLVLTRRDMLPVRVLAELIVLYVPQYQDQEVAKVIASLRQIVKGKNDWLDEALQHLLSVASSTK